MHDTYEWLGRLLARLLLVAAIGVLSLVTSAAPTSAAEAERIIDLRASFELRMDGSMHVTETITYDFGGAPDRHGIERFVPVTFSYDADRNREYPLTGAKASSPSGAPSGLALVDPEVTLRVGDADRTVSGVQTYVLEYDLGAVVNTVGGGQELYWNAIGDQWRVPIEKALVTVTGPGAAVQRATCFQGGRGSTEPCTWSVEDGVAQFSTTRTLPPGQGLTVVAGFPAGTFPNAVPVLREKWSLTKAFTIDPVTGGASAAVLAVLAGGTGLLVSRRGRDRKYLGLTPGLAPAIGDEVRTGRVGRRRSPVAVQFTPPKELRVGELGTLIDEHAEVKDVTATIVDLAVRGYLRIEEIGSTSGDEGVDPDEAHEDDDEDDEDWDEETKATFARLEVELAEQIAKREAKERAKAERRAARGRWFGRPAPAKSGEPGVPTVVRGAAEVPPAPSDWALVKIDRSVSELREYEAELYESLFEGRSRVRLSALSTTFSADLRLVQTMLYREVTERGWFQADPRAVRTRWGGYGTTVLGAGIIGTVVLAVFTHLAVIGVATLVAGVVMIVLAQRMPARTAAGTALLAQAQGFRLYLETAEADQIRFEEGQDVFSRYLPYAIVFGVAQRWADVFANLAASGRALPQPDWYVGYGYAWGSGFDYHRFGTSMDSFSDSTTSSIAASPPASPSASGSSGFSGGFSGGGGGGGGGGSW